MSPGVQVYGLREQPDHRKASSIPTASDCAGVARCHRAAVGGQVVLDGLQEGAFLRARIGAFEDRLRNLPEQLVVPEATRFEVGVHPALLAGFPELHQPVEAVNKRRRRAARRRLPEAPGLAAVPRLQLCFAAGGAGRLDVLAGGCGAAAGKEIGASGKIAVREVAGESVEDDGPGGRRPKAEVAAVE